MPAWLFHGWAEEAIAAANASGMYAVPLVGLRVAPRRAAPRGTLSQLSGRRSMSPPQFGGAVYVVDFQIFARNVGYFSALVETTNQPLELAAHLVFGAVLAALLLLAKPRAAARTKP